MSQVQIAFALGYVAGAMTIGVILFAVAIRNALVVETASPETYQVIAEITAERNRQVEVEGFTALKDDHKTGGTLAFAASAYAYAAARSAGVVTDDPMNAPPRSWPWSAAWWKPETPRRALVKAGALIVAEIERLDRAANRVREDYA